MYATAHHVCEVMTHAAVAVSRDTAFKEIVRTLEQWKVSAVPVLEGEGRVIGVVSEADLLPKEEFRDGEPDRDEELRRLSDPGKAGGVTAEELMSTPAVTVHPDATLAEAAAAMARRHVKRLPVVNDQGLLEGIVSRSDLLKIFLRSDEEIAEEIRRDIVPPLFPAPPEPVEVTVADGVVTLSGRVRDTSLLPVAARLVRAVEGVVDVELELPGPLPRSAPQEPPRGGARPV
ncbi:CBS domain-containing protein [Streptomyces sp. GC420]|uniref:CBS domain-containing protein n=1 Tax=Streptomyces sp. GC420 TaxID=2697568 RepID=UPI001414FB45|nr:CBS domain-containing protein [Streptomyces sp. GC420]NBM17733.1 CBS domain-containing protein [Streptomyces sp. GC420]